MLSKYWLSYFTLFKAKVLSYRNDPALGLSLEKLFYQFQFVNNI